MSNHAGISILLMVLLPWSAASCSCGTESLGNADAVDEGEVDSPVDEIEMRDPIDDVPEDPLDVFELPEVCTPDGPELVGCPSSEGASHCMFSDESVVITGTGEPLAIQFFDDHVGIVQSWDDASWGYRASTYYLSFNLDGSRRGAADLGAELSRAAVWTGGDFSAFPCQPGSFIRVLSSGEFLDERELVGCYHWVAWTGDGFAGIGTDPSDYGREWFMAHISTDGGESRTGPGADLTESYPPPIGVEWTGCSFVVATSWSGGYGTRSSLSTWVRGWDMTDLSAPTQVDEHGLMVNAKLVKAGDGLLVLWTESAEDTDPLLLYARFLDQFGRPCGETVLIDEIVTDLPEGPYRYRAFYGAWADGRAIIFYATYTDGETAMFMRSLLTSGEIGASSVEYIPVGCLSRLSGGLGAAAGGDRAAFWFNYSCATDSPDDYDLRVHTCE